MGPGLSWSEGEWGYWHLSHLLLSPWSQGAGVPVLS